MGLTFEQPNSVNEGEVTRRPKDERTPVQRIVIRQAILNRTNLEKPTNNPIVH